MGSRSTAAFCKLGTCPTAETLLLYHDAALARETRGEVASHLSGCDFCDAEFYLLSKFPPAGPPQFRPVRMPWALYRLAKELVAASTRAAAIVYEGDRMTLTDA